MDAAATPSRVGERKRKCDAVLMEFFRVFPYDASVLPAFSPNGSEAFLGDSETSINIVLRTVPVDERTAHTVVDSTKDDVRARDPPERTMVYETAQA